MKHLYTGVCSSLVLFSLLFTGCTKKKDMEISDKFRSNVPENIQLLERTNKSLTIAWDIISGATSYTVQLLEDSESQDPLFFYTASKDEDYYEFTNLSSKSSYYARVRANFPYSATSDWAYLLNNGEIARIIPSYGIVEPDFEIPFIKSINSSSSTITAEWSFTGFDESDTEISDSYLLELYNDEAGQNLHISWVVSGLFDPSTASLPKPLRFTFAGLQPSKDYYLKVKNLTKSLESPVKKLSTTPAAPVAATSPSQSGDILISQDFSKFIHGGDIAFEAAAYTVGSAAGRAALVPASGPNPVDATLGQATCNLSTEFNVFDGGNVTTTYTAAAGMDNWGKNGNTSTRPGYIKIGGSKAIAALYTPTLSNIPAGKSVTVRFKVCIYSEGQNYYCDNVLVQAVEGATFSAKGAISNAASVTVKDAATVSVSDARKQFKEYTVTLNNITNSSRIVFSSDPAGVSGNTTRFLLDDIIVSIK